MRQRGFEPNGRRNFLGSISRRLLDEERIVRQLACQMSYWNEYTFDLAIRSNNTVFGDETGPTNSIERISIKQRGSIPNTLRNTARKIKHPNDWFGGKTSI